MFHKIKSEKENDELQILNSNSENKEDLDKRGCIVDKKNNIICPSLGYIREYNIDTIEEGKVIVPIEWKWSHAVEGTILRLYFFNNEWYLSTHKKISAFQSRWSCKFSFGELFIHTLEEIFPEKENVYEWFLSELSKEKIYYFLLRSNFQNRIICHTSSLEPKDKIIYIGFRDNIDKILNIEDRNGIFHSLSFIKNIDNNFNSFNDILKYVEEVVDPFQYQGILGYNYKTHKFIKVINSKYKELVKVRGNNHNLRFRYLEIRNDKVMLEKLYMLYPKFSSVFDEYERLIHKISKKIYRVYIDRYIHNKYITLPKEEYIILRKCNEWFLKNKECRISPKDVLDILNKETCYYLYKMIQRIKNEENIDVYFYRNKIKTTSFDSLQNFYQQIEDN